MSKRRKFSSQAKLRSVALTILVAPGQDPSPPLGSPGGRAAPGRAAHADAAAPQGSAERAPIIPAIRHQLLRSPLGTSARAGHGDGVQGLLRQLDFCFAGAREAKAER